VSFVRAEHEFAGSLDGYPDLAPDLAVEIRSPANTWEELHQKTSEYLAAGVGMVVLAWPERHFIEVHRPGREAKRLGLDDVWEGDDVLPGFSCRVRDLFPPETL
jgi:Uma2 family endonuclease